MKNWVYLFKDMDKAEETSGSCAGVRSLLGEKGTNLCKMTHIGVPIPPGFIITTEACITYLEAGNEFPEGLWEQELEAVKYVESQTSKKFGYSDNPLIVSCRSSPVFSMPGMMDTVLNIGLSDETAKHIIELTGDARFVYDAYRRLVYMFGSVVLSICDEEFEEPLDMYKKKKSYLLDTEMRAEDWKIITETYKAVIKNHKGFEFPQDSYEQLKLTTEAALRHWNRKRAIDYRNAAGIAHNLGTAVNIQTMVFGNMDNSCTGLAFTRSPYTGEPVVCGEYLMNSQGDDLVMGIRFVEDILNMQKELPEAYDDFIEVSKKLEKYFKDVQDIEFVVERGNLWITGSRDAKRTARAGIRIAVDLFEEGIISKNDIVNRISSEQITQVLAPMLPPDLNEQPIFQGINASPGVGIGEIVFNSDLAERLNKDEGKEVILIKSHVGPDDIHGILSSKGLITSEGGATSHGAVISRCFNIPSVVGCSQVNINVDKKYITYPGGILNEGDIITLDGVLGNIYKGKKPLILPSIEKNSDLDRLRIILWELDSANFIDNNLGKLWLLRDVIKNRSILSSAIKVNFPSEVVLKPHPDENYISFNPPNEKSLNKIIKQLNWEIDRDTKIVVNGIIDTLFRVLHNEVGIGNHHTFFRPLADPETLFLDSSKKLMAIKNNSQVIAPSYQLIGMDFYGINKYYKNFLEWSEVQCWITIKIFDYPFGYWRLDKTNPNGENLVIGNRNIEAFQLIVNGKRYLTSDIRFFYNELRKRELSWKWYNEKNTSWIEIRDSLQIINKNGKIDQSVFNELLKLGLINATNELTPIGLSMIIQHSSTGRKKYNH